MIKLKDLINEEIQHIDIWYHGRIIDNEIFSYDYVGGEKAEDQEGPGFYFTSDINNAKRYAEYRGIILKCKLNYKKLIYKTDSKITKINKKIIVDLIKTSPDKDLQLTNFDENPNQAFITAVNAYIDLEYACESYQTIWHDFYRYYPKKYLQCLSKYYDGQWTDKGDNIIHLIVYNPSIIEIMEKVKL